MKNDVSRNLKKWRVNYVVTYSNKHFADVYRKSVFSILQNIAFVRGIDCAISIEHQFDGELNSEGQTDIEEFVSDLVYFRSSVKTKIHSSDFRKMIDLIFQEQHFLGIGGAEFEVGPQMQKLLNQFPFPVQK